MANYADGDQSSIFPLVWIWSLSNDLLDASRVFLFFFCGCLMIGCEPLYLWWKTAAVTLPTSQSNGAILPPRATHISQSSPDECHFEDSYLQAHLWWSHCLWVNESRSGWPQWCHLHIALCNFSVPLFVFLSGFYGVSSIYYPFRNMVNRKKHGHGYPSSFHKSLCLSARVKTSDLFERWRNLQVCRWEQNKEETSNFK